MRLYDKGDLMACPHCGYEYQEPVEDFVVPMSGRECEETCEECEESFYVREVTPGKFEVS